MLEVTGLVKAFGNLLGVDGGDLSIEAGTITELIGPNGAGKTTFLNLIAGALAPEAGAIRFLGERIGRACWSPGRGSSCSTSPPRASIRRCSRRWSTGSCG